MRRLSKGDVRDQKVEGDLNVQPRGEGFATSLWSPYLACRTSYSRKGCPLVLDCTEKLPQPGSQ